MDIKPDINVKGNLKSCDFTTWWTKLSVEGGGCIHGILLHGRPNLCGRGGCIHGILLHGGTKLLWKGVGASMAFYYMGDQTSVGEDWCIHGILLHGRPNLCGRGVGASMTFYYMGGPNFYGREWVHPWHFTTWGTKHLS